MNSSKLMNVIDRRVPGLFFILFMFAALELGILMICAGYSGNQHILKIYSPDNELIYEDVFDENHINEFKNIYGIENFKEEGFVLTREVVDNKFPTRAWIALSIIIPLVVILFVVFIVKIFTDVFNPEATVEQKCTKSNPHPDFEETRLEKMFSTLGRLNMYSLGAVVIFLTLLFWLIPDLLKYLGTVSYNTISEFQWVFLGVIIFVGAYMILKVFLSYKTRTEIIRQQAEIQKNRDRLVIEAKLEQKLLEERLEN